MKSLKVLAALATATFLVACNQNAPAPTPADQNAAPAPAAPAPADQNAAPAAPAPDQNAAPGAPGAPGEPGAPGAPAPAPAP